MTIKAQTIRLDIIWRKEGLNEKKIRFSTEKKFLQCYHIFHAM